MLQLETVEDFEKVRKVLDDPRSRPDQFRIRSFGFCSACNRLTEFCDYNSDDKCKRMCLGCNRVFQFHPEVGAGECYQSNDGQWYETLMCESRDPVTIKKYLQLYSREYQYRFFKTMLEKQIRRFKTEERKIKRKIKQLAKLR